MGLGVGRATAPRGCPVRSTTAASGPGPWSGMRAGALRHTAPRHSTRLRNGPAVVAGVAYRSRVQARRYSSNSSTTRWRSTSGAPSAGPSWSARCKTHTRATRAGSKTHGPAPRRTRLPGLFWASLGRLSIRPGRDHGAGDGEDRPGPPPTGPRSAQPHPFRDPGRGPSRGLGVPGGGVGGTGRGCGRERRRMRLSARFSCPYLFMVLRMRLSAWAAKRRRASPRRVAEAARAPTGRSSFSPPRASIARRCI